MKTWFIRYRDDLPVLPQELVDEAMEAPNGQNIRELQEKYGTRNDPGEQNHCICAYSNIPKLRYWFGRKVKPLLSYQEGNVFVQTIGTDVKIHKDPARRISLNYIIDTGSDNEVRTTHYSEDKSLTVHSEVIIPHGWHEIQTDIFHSVIDHSRKRIGLTFDLVKHYGDINTYHNPDFVAEMISFMRTN